MSVNKYSTTAASNTSIGDGAGAVGIQEGMPRGNVNDAIRAMAADLAKLYKDNGSLVTAGTGSAYTVSTASDFTAYAAGMGLVVKFHADCAAGATINVNALGAKLLKMRKDAGLANVEAGAIRAGEIHHIVYDGTAFTAIGLIDYPKIKSDIAALFALFDGDATSFNNVTASGDVTGARVRTPGGAAELSGSSVNAQFVNVSATVTGSVLQTTGGAAELNGSSVNAQFVNVTSSVNKSGQSYWHPTNDGAGSGMDADLLDGQQGSYYTAITARLGYTPVQNGTGVGQTNNSVKIGFDGGSAIRVSVDSTDFNYLARSYIRSDVMGEISAQSAGAIGTMALLSYVPASDVGPGTNVAGSDLRYSNAYGGNVGATPTGTWKCLGYCMNVNGLPGKTTLFLRIA